MTVRARLIASRKNSPFLVHEHFEFVALPRVGEKVALIEDERDFMIEVTEVVHTPSGPKTLGPPGPDVHVWGKVTDDVYQV